ncbi:unnamed protein product [Urochloa humidicola]
MTPLNLSEEKLDSLSAIFNCQKGSLPFTYLGLPLGTTKPSIEDCLPLIQRVEKRLNCTSALLSQGGKLEMVNTVLSSSTIFFSSTFKLHKGVIKQLDKYRKHCLWRGGDLNSKKPSKAAWPTVCLPKSQGGLGVLNLEEHNNALLMKFLHKFFTKADIPWVKLVWDNYYKNGRLPGQFKKGSFWWRDIIKLMDKYKEMAEVFIADGSTVKLWEDKWNGNSPAVDYPELLSFAKNKHISFQLAVSKPRFIQNFHLPLSIQAHQQLLLLEHNISQVQRLGEKDQWKYQWGNSNFTSHKAYKVIIGSRQVHPLFLWLWKSKCQMKHKVFFWLLLKDRLSTRDLLARRNMELDSYSCELCILQKRETCAHLFLRCNFAKACWASIGVSVVTTRSVYHILRQIKDKLQIPFFMEVIVLMSWSIWNVRNDWLFNAKDPTVQDCHQRFLKEFNLLLLRVRQDKIPIMINWRDAL